MKSLLIILSLSFFTAVSYANETVSEKTEVKANLAERTLKKGYHRLKEAVCGTLTGDNKLECLAQKAKHRVEEGVETAKDTASEVKNDLDPDKK